MNEDFEALREYVRRSQSTVCVTGAGISYLYGMRRLKQSAGLAGAGHLFSTAFIRKHPEKFYVAMKEAFLDATFVKGPSEAHRLLARLEEEGRIVGIATQNLDCLHTIAGSKNVAEFQGSFQDNVCIDCGARFFDYRVWGQGQTPRCEKCGGFLMPSSFCTENGVNRAVMQTNMEKASSLIAGADLVLIIGTTGFRSDEYLRRLRPGTPLIQINPGHTSFDGIAALNVRADAADALKVL